MYKDYIDWNSLVPNDKNKIFVSYGDNEALKEDFETWLDISELPQPKATIWRNRPGCDYCLFQSGTHDKILINLEDSIIFQPLDDYLTSNSA